MPDFTALRSEFAALSTAEETFQKMLVDAKRDPTPEEKTASDARFARLEQIRTQLESAKKLAGLAFSQGDAGRIENPSLPAGGAGDSPEISIKDRFEKAGLGRREFAKFVNDYLRSGRIDPRFAAITGATESGILLPTDVMAPIIPQAQNVLREALTAVGLEPLRTPTTRTINLPIYTAAAGGAITPGGTTELENEAALTESVQLVVTGYHSGNYWFDNMELMAVDFDLLTATVPAMQYAKELALESAVIAALKADGGITQSVACATTAGFTYANLVSLNRALPKRYQVLKTIVLSKTAYTAAENLVTTTGFPILNQDAQNQNLKRFNGTPVVYSEYLDDLGAANKIVGFCMSWMGARLRDAGQGNIVQRFTQTANRQGQTGADLIGYHSFAYTEPSIATLKTPAS